MRWTSKVKKRCWARCLLILSPTLETRRPLLSTLGTCSLERVNILHRRSSKFRPPLSLCHFCHHQNASVYPSTEAAHWRCQRYPSVRQVCLLGQSAEDTRREPVRLAVAAKLACRVKTDAPPIVTLERVLSLRANTVTHSRHLDLSSLRSPPPRRLTLPPTPTTIATLEECIPRRPCSTRRVSRRFSLPRVPKVSLRTCCYTGALAWVGVLAG